MYLFLDNPGHFISSLAIFTGVNFKHEDDKYLNYIEKSTMYYVSAPISTQAKHKTTLCNSVMDANANELLGGGIRDGRYCELPVAAILLYLFIKTVCISNIFPAGPTKRELKMPVTKICFCFAIKEFIVSLWHGFNTLFHVIQAEVIATFYFMSPHSF